MVVLQRGPLSRRLAFVLCTIAQLLFLTAWDVSARTVAGPEVREAHLPSRGLQPQAVYRDGVLHVVYFEGEPAHGNIFYLRSTDDGKTFDKALQVNSQEGSAVATGTIRGAQLAVGKGGRVHVAWNGSTVAEPRGPLNPEMKADSPYNATPMLYSRLGDDGHFEPQRNLMRKTFGLDGGGTVAADAKGDVYVAWHGKALGAEEGEQGRRVWMATSTDDGRTFSEEREIFGNNKGACGCCGMKLYADAQGDIAGLYRSARNVKHRDTYLMFSRAGKEKFRGARLDEWEISACPMSSMALVGTRDGLLAGWETAGQVLFSHVEPDGKSWSDPVAAPGEGKKRKHPRLARNSRGETLLLWTEVPGWGKSGVLHYQAYGPDGSPLGESVRVGAAPPWSFGAVVANQDDTFTVLY